MTITPDQARKLRNDARPGQWYVNTDPDDTDDTDETYIYNDTGNLCIVVNPADSAYCEADLTLAAAAPDLAQTIAGMRWEYGVEQAIGTTQWFRSRPMAEAHAEVRGAFRLVRRLVGPVEEAE